MKIYKNSRDNLMLVKALSSEELIINQKVLILGDMSNLFDQPKEDCLMIPL
jgi:hypothetical protein